MKALDDFMWLHEKVELLFSTKGPRSHFFGYYDKSPFDGDERRLLCHAVDFDGRMVQAGDRAGIGFWDLSDGSYTRLGETEAFNWQQGSMLQWLPGTDYTQVIYNDRANNHFAAIILDVQAEDRHVLPITIYSLASDGHYAVTPRFERLYYCRPGYCYQGIEQPQWNARLPLGDGIWCLNLKSGTQELILETKALAESQRLPSMQGATHYVEHPLIAPDGKKLIFLHRWVVPGDGTIVTRLYGCNLDGTDLRMYPDTGMYSHAIWQDPDSFIVWGRQPNAYAQIRLKGNWRRVLTPLLRFHRRYPYHPMIQGARRRIARDAFLRFSGPEQPEIVGRGRLEEDGHPSVCPGCPQLLLVDTYEDKQNYRHLKIYNMESDVAVEIGRFYSPDRFNRTSFRCDLHPRWSPSGRLVCVDRAYRGGRQMLVLDVSGVLEEFSAKPCARLCTKGSKRRLAIGQKGVSNSEEAMTIQAVGLNPLPTLF